MSIKFAEFVGDPTSGEVIVGGRKPFFYSYDTVTGRTVKIPGLFINLFVYLFINLFINLLFVCFLFHYFFIRNSSK